ncbi:replicative DNA helicase [Paludibacter sp. 221]|uniref:replicative DNA helicase n=1 Tax=Paludibacter sp. 221 TaxID=2302939 RepID=UPI0013D56A62|nr:replicative DNA helicase [Paludibacter sp. 221]NDV46279.1 replicative DNA helicase [Paludibacter sp. 221]
MNNFSGHILPQAAEIEESVLGALMTESNAFEKINLEEKDFYKETHKLIFRAIRMLSDKREPVDMHTVTEQLRKNGDLETVGGLYQIALLTAGLSSAAHIERHALIIKQKSIARELIQTSVLIQQKAFDETLDIAETLEFSETEFTRIFTESASEEVFSMEETLSVTLNHYADIQRKRARGENPFIPTGLRDLNHALNGGWSAPDLIVIGGRPSMGKTQFAVHFAKHAGFSANETLFISIEMTKIQLASRLLTENEGINFYNMKTGQLSEHEWGLIDEKANDLLKSDIKIADGSKVCNLGVIKSLARKQKRKGDLKLLIIDYLQLIETNMKFQNRDIEVGYITRQLKNLAKELNIPIILLAQLNRPKDGAKVPEPRLENLRESGNIEQDADIVIFPHRPYYYDQEAIDGNGRSWKNRGYLIIAKSREGERGHKIYFQHDDNFKKIFEEGLTQNPF